MTTSELFLAHLGNIGNPTNTEIYSDDLKVEFAYAPKHHTQGLSGIEAIVRFLTNVGVYFEGYTVSNVRLIEGQDPDVVVAEFHGSAVSKETGLGYEQEYIVVVRAKNGKIDHMREFYNPVHVLVATGEIEEPGE
ncbi:MAG: nuclear transport factor 2 family protein [Fimbriimonas sp.]